MGLFYKATNKEILTVRNQLFLEKGIPALTKNGFVKSPFSTAWYGRNDHQGFTYELCRVNDKSLLERLEIHIVNGEKWIQIKLNIFELIPTLKSITDLKGFDGLQFVLPPNSLSEMRLRVNDFNGSPLFHMLFRKALKLGTYYTKKGLQKRTRELSQLIGNDMRNIDGFVKRWHLLHVPLKTNWEGYPINAN